MEGEMMSIILKGINLPSKNARDYIIIAWYENNTHGGLDLKSKFVEYADIIQIPKGHGRLIDANKLEAMMYHEAFEIDSDLQKWDSGCWIRYKVFENCMNKLLPDTILEPEADG